MYFFKDEIKNTQLSNILGLDITNGLLNWVILKPSYELQNFAIETFPHSKNNQLKDTSQIAAILQRSLADRQEVVKNCVVNIPDNLVCSKYIQVDNIADKNCDDDIHELVERSIPYPLNALYFDYQIVDHSLANQCMSQILLVACRKEHLDLRLDILKKANLVPLAVEVNSHAIERAYKYLYSTHENHIFLYLGIDQLIVLFFDVATNSTIYSENFLDKDNKESTLMQIKRCIKNYYLTYPYNELSQLFIVKPNLFFLDYLVSELNGFLDLKISILSLEELNFFKNFNLCTLGNIVTLLLSYGLALRTISS